MSNQPSSAAYTTGPIRKTMLRTAMAMVAGTVAISGYNIVDTYFVGRLGTIPMAAMGFTFPIIMIIGCIFFGTAAGIMTTTAQALGGNNSKRAARIVTSGTHLLILVSLVVCLIGVFASPVVFRMMGADEHTLPLAIGYMNIWYIGCVTASLSMAGNKLLISAGDSNAAAVMMVVGLVVNAVLDPIFIFGYCGCPAMGIGGAAAATVLSQFISTVLLFLLLDRKHHLIEYKFYNLREVGPMWNLILKYAIPSAIGMLMMPIASFVITWITARFGNAAVAAVAAAGRLEGIAFIFPMALGIPMLSMVAQNYGAKLYSRIRECFRFSMTFAFVYLFVMAVIYFLFSHYLVDLFSNDPEVRRLMTLCLLIVSWGFGPGEVHRYSGFFYTGCGRPAFSAWLNAFRILGLLLPLSFVALYFNSITILFFARLIADSTSGITGCYLTYRMIGRLPKTDGEEDSAH